MSHYPTPTGYILFFNFLLLTLYDLYVIFIVKDLESSITHVLFDFCQRNPIIGVGIGVLIGHTFWPHK